MRADGSRRLKNDLLLCVCLLAAALSFFLLMRGGRRQADASDASQEGTVILITVDDREAFREDAAGLRLPMKLDLDGYRGGHNVFEIGRKEGGEIYIRCLEADCPDKICVHTGTVVLPDQPIVCLPHRITARILKTS